MKMRLVMAVALALTMATGGVAFADKPVTTRFASTKEVGTFRLDQTFHFSRTEDDDDNSLVPFDEEHDRERARFETTLIAGVAKRVEVAAVFPVVMNSEDDDDEPDVLSSDDDESWGVGDITLAARYRFYEGSKIHLAIEPVIFIPTGNEEEGHGIGKFAGGGTLIASMQGETFGLHLNGGFLTKSPQAFEAGAKNIIPFSVAATAKVAGRVTLAAEMLGEHALDFEDDDDNDGNTPIELSFAALWSVTPYFDIHGAVNAGVSEGAPDLGFRLGFAVAF